MKLTLESTHLIGRVDRTPCREWHGTDEHGTPVIAMIAMVMVHKNQPADTHARFAQALREVSERQIDVVRATDLRHCL